jgi:hypothetical protein
MRARKFLPLACFFALWLFAVGRIPSGVGWFTNPARTAESSTRLLSLVPFLWDGAVLGQGSSGPAEAGPDTTGAGAGEPLGNAFTYQGQLLMGGVPVTGVCDLQFSLWDAPTGGASVAATQTAAEVAVQNGLFTLQLDFGALAFNGEARWLEVSARCPAGSGVLEQLTPRQSLTAVPYALHAASVPWGALVSTPDYQALELRAANARAMRLEFNPVSPNVIGGHGENGVGTDVVGATIGGGGASNAANRVTDNYGTVAGGSKNQAGNDDAWATNVPHATVSGGERNVASGSHATVGGGLYNTASGYASTVSGGGGFDDVIGTPLSNTATGSFSTVGGGVLNAADGFGATVGGGESNAAGGEDAVVSGGSLNSATGLGGAIPGGEGNVAAGNYSFAAGRKAKADHQGAFVWADSTDAELHSERNDQFRVQANGGVRLDVNSGGWVNIWQGASGRLLDTSTGAYLSLGGTWTNASGREQKENLAPVDGREVLLRLAHLPIATWNYKAEDPSIRHMGPMAEDFAVFGLGQDSEHIGTVDADGVSLAAIQGLYQLSQEQAARIGQLEQQNAALEGRLAALEELVAQLAQPTK